MGGLAIFLAAAVGYAQPAAENHAAERLVIIFERAAAVETQARELCLREGCRVEATFPLLAGVVVTGVDETAVARHASVRSVFRDVPVELDKGADKLVGAPSDGPLVVIGGNLTNGAMPVERSVSLIGGRAPSRSADTAGLLEPLSVQGGHTLWSYVVLDETDTGRLSDVFAALQDTVRLRYAIAAVYIPLALKGEAPAPLCQLLNDVLRRGMLVVTEIDSSCPLP